MEIKTIKALKVCFTTIQVSHKLINIYEKNKNKISLNKKIIKLTKTILKELEKDNPDVKIIDNISLKIVEYSKNNNFNKKNLFIEEKGEELIIRNKKL